MEVHVASLLSLIPSASADRNLQFLFPPFVNPPSPHPIPLPRPSPPPTSHSGPHASLSFTTSCLPSLSSPDKCAPARCLPPCQGGTWLIPKPFYFYHLHPPIPERHRVPYLLSLFLLTCSMCFCNSSPPCTAAARTCGRKSSCESSSATLRPMLSLLSPASPVAAPPLAPELISLHAMALPLAGGRRNRAALAVDAELCERAESARGCGEHGDGWSGAGAL